MVVVRRANVRLRADISGVITATMSSWPITRSSRLITGFWTRYEPSRWTCHTSRNSTNKRASGSAAISRACGAVFGSMRAAWTTGGRGRITSKLSTFCGRAVFENFEIFLLEIGDGLPVRGHVGVEPDQVGARAKPRRAFLWLPRILLGGRCRRQRQRQCGSNRRQSKTLDRTERSHCSPRSDDHGPLRPPTGRSGTRTPRAPFSRPSRS